MILISAMGANRVIGSGDGMPWSVPAEYAQFLEFVRGNAVLMGRRSWEIFGGDLADSHNVVVSRSASAVEGAVVESTLETAIERARGFGGRLFVAGGARVYAQTLPLADALYLSTIHGTFEGDAFFPEFDPEEWPVSEEREHDLFTFRIHRRATPPSSR